MGSSPTPEREPTSVPWTFGDILRGVAAGFVIFILSLVPITLIVMLGFERDLSGVSMLVLVGGSLYVSVTLALWYFAIRRRGARLTEAGFVNVSLGTLALMPLVTVGTLILNVVVVLSMRPLIGDVPGVREQALPEGVTALTASDFALLMVIGVIIAPIAEEFLFRGLLFRYLRGRWGFLAAGSVSAAVFAAAHFSPRLIPSLFLLGLVLAAITERYRSVYPAVSVHALNNAFVLVVLYVGMT